MEKDLVCGMEVDPSDDHYSCEYKNKKYYFCADSCLKKFNRNPEEFINPKPLQNISNSKALYTCPMHPEIEQVGMGSCPKCGMSLEALEIDINDKALDNELKEFNNKFIVAAIFTLPLMILSMSEMMVSLGALQPYSIWIQFILCLPVLFWSGFPIFERAYQSTINRNPNMFTLIGIGSLAAFFYSLFLMIFPNALGHLSHSHSGHSYFESAAGIITLVLMGQVLEIKSRIKTTDALRSLIGLTPRFATRVSINENSKKNELKVLVQLLVNGDLIRIHPGEKIPVDGILVEGESTVDESMLSGEAMPIDVKINSKVHAGAINGAGTFIFKAEKVGKETLLAQIVQAVALAQRSRAPIQKVADKISYYFVPGVMVVSIFTGFIWYFFGPEPKDIYAMVNAVSVLIIACPCALGLATPMSIMVAAGRGAKSGLLIKNAENLEILSQVKILFIDKTGTLTEGKPKVIEVRTIESEIANHEVEKFAAVAGKSDHPLSVAFAQKMDFANNYLVTNFKALSGEGLSAEIEGSIYKVGKKSFIQIWPQKFEEEIKNKLKNATPMLFLGKNDEGFGYVCFHDPIKESAYSAINELRRLRVEVVLLSGDRKEVVEEVSKELGIVKYYSNLLPIDKLEIIKNAHKNNAKVAMAGDGINDAPALTAADVGIAMGTGSDIALQSSGITIINGELTGILKAIKLSKATVKNIKQNLFFAFIYNFVGVPIAAGILYPFFGILLSPVFASVAMSLSSVSVILNSLRLKNLKL